MKRMSMIALLLVTGLIFISLSSMKEEKAKPKFQRIVCFKFKDGASAEARTKHMVAFAAFVKAVPQVLSYRVGKTVKGESKTAPEFDVMHYMTFEKEQDIILYDEHAEHKKFVEGNKGSWEKVMVVNGAIEK